MKKYFFLLSMLLGSIGLNAQYKVHTEDVVRFWEAVDKVQTTDDPARQVKIIKEVYVDKATIGLQEFMELRGGNAERWQHMITNNQERLSQIRPNTLSVLEQKPLIDEKLARFKALYPDFKDGDVYFTIGIGNSGGTLKGNHVLIGCEVVANDSKTWAVPIVMHEFVHTQQQNNPNGNLLTQCINEGMADFISELTLDRKIAEIHPNGHIAFGLENNKAVWKEFKQFISATRKGMNYYGWLYGGREVNGRKVTDLGYYMGYAICKSFYDQATDKKAAIAEMLTMDLSTDEGARAFLLKSGYVPKKDIAFVKNLEFGELILKEKKKVLYGYKETKDHIVFQMKLPDYLSPEEVEMVSVAGSFNEWNPKAEGFKMQTKGKKNFELAIPKSQLAQGKTHTFKFVVNGDNWLQAPDRAKNVAENGYGNLTVQY